MIKQTFVIIFILLLSINLYADDANKKNEVRKANPYGSAPIISLIIPGGGHFWLGEYATGSVYAVSEITLFGGGIYFLNEGVSFMIEDKASSDKNLNIALGFAVAFAAVKVIDVIHAGRTAAEKNNQSELLLGFDPSIQNHFTPKLTYSYKF